MVYVIMLMVFVTVLFAGTAAAFNARTKVTATTLEKQQLQLTAQSALNAVKDEFLSNEELWNNLERYAKGNQSASFTLSENTGITDDVTVKITHEGGTKARITVTASNDSGSISSAFAVLDWGEDAPAVQSAGVTDNLLVVFMPDKLGDSGDGNGKLTVDAGLQNKSIEGNILYNNYGTNELKVTGPKAVGSIYTTGNIFFNMFQANALSEDAGSKIVSLYGKINTNNQFRLSKGFDLLAARYGYRHMTDDSGWDNPNLTIVTGVGSDFTMDNMAITGNFGNIISGGKTDIYVKTGLPFSINSIKSLGDVKFKEENGSATTIKNDFISGGDINFKISRGSVDVKNLAAMGSITGGGQNGTSNMELNASNIYAGNGISLDYLNKLITNGLLSKADGSGVKTLKCNENPVQHTDCSKIRVGTASVDYVGFANQVQDDNATVKAEIEKIFSTELNTFNKSIPLKDDGSAYIPNISIPYNGMTFTTASQYSASANYATVREIGEDIVVIGNGYIQVNANGNQPKSITAQTEDGTVQEFYEDTHRNLVFDTESQSYDVLLGVGNVGDIVGGEIYLGMNICVKQADDTQNFVRIFVDENCNLNLMNGAVKNLTNNGLIPEVYILSNGYNKIKAPNYYLSGYIVAPKCMVDLSGSVASPIDDSISFEGLIICGDIRMPLIKYDWQRGNKMTGYRMVYHQPTTNGITADIYSYDD
jgi:hypothetical protein